MGLFNRKKKAKKGNGEAVPVSGEDDGPRPPSRTLVKKIALLGDPAVGKTSLIQRFVYDVFDDTYLSTIGAKMTKKTMEFKARDYDHLPVDTTLNFLIWDIAGQRAFKSVHQTYYMGSEAALIVCDITRKETLDNIMDWITEIYKVVGNIPILFLVNKYDLKDLAFFGELEIQAAAEQINARYFFTSAKTGLNVEESFQQLAEMVLGIRPREE